MKHWQLVLLFAIFFPCATLSAQSASSTAKALIAAPAPIASAATAEIAQRSFHDPAYKISFDYPANWNFTRRDHEISTFRLDARTAVRTTLMRAVVSMPENPFPDSTFSGTSTSA
jgi:uncharacterized protein YijF (DUF1287 family)